VWKVLVAIVFVSPDPCLVADYTVYRYKVSAMAIISFKCAATRELFVLGRSRRFAPIGSVAARKLTQLDAAPTLMFLLMPPGNCLEKLRGDRDGQYSIRINGQWRICFAWTEQGPADVEIVDYH